MGKYKFLSHLVIEEVGNEHEKYVKKVANSIMNIASLREKKDANKVETDTIKNALKIICSAPMDWKEYEKLILDNLEKYIRNGYHGEYCFEDNDVCVGTLNFLDFLYERAVKKGAKFVQYDRVKKMQKSMEKINQRTIEQTEFNQKIF